ncbi:large subunit ribosomal protein L31e [Methanohalophilus levihalophilus]|uniref:50S ribosomal protein L31e n=1 Tax=Methanohalophilus levihalophilus TaxID=1431282 RepID=UPI001AE7C2CB|nr:50S ribosomal protein L31e [Methanohalophilus levihalophilus]MBP2031230.1 large subunit ribosomal protein L31e [Methanohalophilus levihalophilus]
MEGDIVKEQVYTIPLRAAKLAPKWRRANRAITLIRKYLIRHMKADPKQIKIDSTINELIWNRGSEKPPSSIRVRAAKFDDGEVQAELA